MGGSKKQTVGYKYSIGAHMGLCEGPIDFLRKIKVDNKVLVQGKFYAGTLDIDMPELFGGESREGGITGLIDYMDGSETQEQNEYLVDQIGEEIPYYRGFASVVLNQVYVGINPYLKNWSFSVQRIHTTQDGEEQWYDEKAEIVISPGFETDQMFYFCLDYSCSMRNDDKIDNLKQAMEVVLDEIERLRTLNNVRIDIGICLFNYENPPKLNFINIDDGDIELAKAFVDDTDVSCNTQYSPAVAAADFFFRTYRFEDTGISRKVVFLTDGAPYPVESGEIAPEIGKDLIDKYSGDFCVENDTVVDFFCFNIEDSDTYYTSLLDNTENDTVPVISSNYQDIKDAIFWSCIAGYSAMNPAHIIRECILNSNWGLNYSTSDIDSDSFTTAADTLYSEGLGLCLLWDRQITIEDFILYVLKHIEGVLYVSRETGKFVLKLIRDDFVRESLLVLNKTNIISVSDLSRPSMDELINSVTVKYWNWTTEQEASITVTDTALITMQGSEINVTKDYTGLPSLELASKVAARDLKSVSNPLLTCTITGNRKCSGLNPGDVFKFEWSENNIEISEVMRVISVEHGDGLNNAVRIKATQDVFSFPEFSQLSSTGITELLEEVDPLPTPTYQQKAIEAPYYHLVMQEGQEMIDMHLTNNNYLGFFLAMAGNPDHGYSAVIHAKLDDENDDEYKRESYLYFCPMAQISEDMLITDEEISVINTNRITSVEENTLAIIGDEIIKVVSVTETTMTFKRGCLDTVPKKHYENDYVFFYDSYHSDSSPRYVYGQTVNVKILSLTGRGVLPVESAVVLQVNILARAYSPYPPGQFKICDEYFPEEIDSTPFFSWVHRNRIQQTSGIIYDFTSDNITPEDDQESVVSVYNMLNERGRRVQTEDRRYAYTMERELEDFGSRQVNLKVKLESIREGFESHQNHYHTFTKTAFPDWHPNYFNWIIRTSAEDNEWTSVVWSEFLGNYYAVARTGTKRLMYSPDGINWSARTTTSKSYQAICCSEDLGLLVTVISDPTGAYSVLYSGDGISFTAALAGAFAFRDVIYDENIGYFIAVNDNTGGTSQIYTSTNGTTWANKNISSNNNGFRSVAWGEELGVGVAISDCSSSASNGAAYATETPLTWTSTSVPEANLWISCAYDKELRMFVAVAYDGTNRAMYSYDGINWSLGVDVPVAQWRDVISANGVFIAVATTGTTGYLSMVSFDGINWDLVETPVDNEWSSIAMSYSLKQFVAVGFTGTGNRCMSTALLNSYWTTTSTTTISFTGSTTTFTTSSTSSSTTSSTSSSTTSSTSSSTTSSSTSTSSTTSSSSTSSTSSTTSSSSTSSTSSTTTTISSVETTTTIQINWIIRTSAEDNEWVDVVWSEFLGNYYAVARTGTNRLMYSPDGINWSARTTTSKSCQAICCSEDLELLVTVISDPTASYSILYSGDGISFTAAIAGPYAFRDVIYDENIGYFIAVNDNSGSSQIYISTNGTTWSAKTISSNTNSFRSVAWGNGVGIAVSNCSSGASNGAAYATETPLSWTSTSVPEANLWISCAYDEYLEMFVAVAYDGTNRAMYSYDGINWSLGTSVPVAQWRDVTSINGGFLAVARTGTSGYLSMISYDGINWDLVETPVDNYWGGVTKSQSLNQFVAVGFSGTGNRCMSTAINTTTSTSTSTTTTV